MKQKVRITIKTSSTAHSVNIMRNALCICALSLLLLSSSWSAYAQDDNVAATLLSHSSAVCENYAATAPEEKLITEQMAQQAGHELSVFADLNYTICPNPDIKAPVASVWYPDQNILAYASDNPWHQTVQNLLPVIWTIANNKHGPLAPKAYDEKGNIIENAAIPTIYAK